LPLSDFLEAFLWPPGGTSRCGIGFRYLLLCSRAWSPHWDVYSRPTTNRVPSGHPFVVLNYNYWRTRFAADPQIVGKTLNLNNYNMTVVGVAQAGFDGVELGRSPKIFIPIMMQPQIIVGNPEDMLKERRNRWVNAFGWLKPGVSQQQAKPLSHRPSCNSRMLERASSARRSGFVFTPRRMTAGISGSVGSTFCQGPGSFLYAASAFRRPYGVLMATTGAVLLIACANLANLMLCGAPAAARKSPFVLAIGPPGRASSASSWSKVFLCLRSGGSPV